MIEGDRLLITQDEKDIPLIPESGNTVDLLTTLIAKYPTHSPQLENVLRVLTELHVQLPYQKLSTLYQYEYFTNGKISRLYSQLNEQGESEYSPFRKPGYQFDPYAQYSVDKAIFVLVHPAQRFNQSKSRWVSIANHRYTAISAGNPVLTIPHVNFIPNLLGNRYLKFYINPTGPQEIEALEHVNGVTIFENANFPIVMQVGNQIIHPTDPSQTDTPLRPEAYIKIDRKRDILNKKWEVYGISAPILQLTAGE